MRRHRNVIDRGFVIAVLAKALEGGIDDMDLLLLIECKKFLQYAHILSITESVTICIVARITESVNMDFEIFQLIELDRTSLQLLVRPGFSYMVSGIRFAVQFS